jgi:outer membrane immunogenic protein
LAADLPPYEAAIVAPAPISQNWTGFYVGGFAGWGWADIDVDQLENSDGVTYNIGGSYGMSDDGFHGGVQVGYDWQWNSFVAGVVGEAGALRLDDSEYDPSSIENADGVPDTRSFFESDWYGALSARVGVAFDRFLIYAKGGVALVNAEAETVDTCLRRRRCGASVIDASDDDVQFGWTAGGGVEFLITQHWSAGAEYRYFNFDLEPSGDAGGAAADLDDNHFSQDFDVDVHTIRAAINYRW